MLPDILAVFVVTLVSSLLLCTTSVHGLPASPSTHQYIQKQSSIDLSSPLRFLEHHPVPSVDYDLGGDPSEMLIGENNDLPTVAINHENDVSSSSNEPFNFYLHPLRSKSSSRKFLLSFLRHRNQRENEEEEEDDVQQKRSNSPSIAAPHTVPTQFNLNSAFADLSHANSVVNYSQLSESTRLSPSLEALVKTNPFARTWLTMLLQKVMEEQPVPYIFKYGRRRKK